MDLDELIEMRDILDTIVDRLKATINEEYRRQGREELIEEEVPWDGND